MQKLALEVLQSLNRAETPNEAIEQILRTVKKFTGVSAVGIRLREDHDYPYFYFDGFSDVHMKKEHSLYGYDEEGNLITDSEGRPVLDCMCGVILRGETDPGKPFFTERGSFVSNNTTRLIKTAPKGDRKIKTRNVCNTEGYESVALIPLRSKDSIIGLLQLNDENTDMYTDEMIHFLEGLGDGIGIALAHLEEAERRREAEKERERLLKQYELRLRELNILFSVSELLDKPDLTLEETLQGVTDLIPSGMQYPESAVARVVVEDKEFTTEGFRETRWMLETPLKVYGRGMGAIEVHYLEEKPESHRGPFTEEEVKLLESLAEQLLRVLEHETQGDWRSQLDRYALILTDEEVRHVLGLVQEDIAINEMDSDGLSGDIPQDGGDQVIDSWLYLKTMLELNRSLIIKLQNLLGEDQ